VVIQL